MATLNLRKLFNDSHNLNDAITKYCEPFCDPLQNRDGLCPVSCISRCFPICKTPLFFDIPPPTGPENLSNSNDHHHHSSGSYRLSVTLTITLAILATAFFIFCCYILCKFFIARYRSTRQQPPQQLREEEIYRDLVDEYQGPAGIDHPIWYIRTVGLQPSVINGIAICNYRKSDGLVEGTECSVCLSEFQEDDSLRLLPKCNHAFHLPCIDSWLTSHTNCPLCRAAILTNCPSLQSREELNTHGFQQSQVENSAFQNESGGAGERREEGFHVIIEVEDEEEQRAQNEPRMNEDFEEDVGNSDTHDAVSANSDRFLEKQGNQMIQSNMGFAAKSVNGDDQNSVVIQLGDDRRKD